MCGRVMVGYQRERSSPEKSIPLAVDFGLSRGHIPVLGSTGLS